MRNCLLDWCEYSQKVRQSLAERGVIQKVACELGELRIVPEITEVSHDYVLMPITCRPVMLPFSLSPTVYQVSNPSGFKSGVQFGPIHSHP